MSETKKQGISWSWALIFVLIVAAALFNMYRARSMDQQLREVNAKLLAGVSQEEYQGLMGLSLKHNGRVLKWPELQTIGGTIERTPGDLVVMAFDEKSCNSCRDSETRFIQTLAQELGAERVAIIIAAESARYVKGFRSTNGLDFPVYYDQSGAFFAQNQIQKTPITFLVNDRGEVVMGHFPAPERPELSKPFRGAIAAYFDLDPSLFL